MKGRRPQAIETRSKERSKRDLPDRVLVSGRGDWPEPTHLDERARQVWAELVPPLQTAGVLDRIDRSAFELMCVQFSRAEDARVALESLPSELGDLDERLRDDRELLDSIKANLRGRIEAQVEGLNATRSILVEAINEGSSGEVLKKITELVERIESAAVSPGELAAVAKLETTLTSLDEFLKLRAAGHKVALGSTGQVTAHPLLAEERAAAALVLRFGEHYAVTPVARARLGLASLQGASLKRELEDELGLGVRRPSRDDVVIDADDAEFEEVVEAPAKRKPSAKRKTSSSRKTSSARKTTSPRKR